MEKVIEIRDLYKSFGAVKAVNGITFRVKRGELFAFLGVNGAGKSTTISILSGQLKRTRAKSRSRGATPTVTNCRSPGRSAWSFRVRRSIRCSRCATI